MKKYASTGALLEPLEVRELTGLEKAAHRHTFAYEPREGFVYVRSRAISSRTNDNFDTFPAEELKKAWGSFIGKPVFVNHHNEDITRKRGVIIDAALHEDTGPDGLPDTWVEVLMEVDAVRFPRLAAAVVKKDIERTSMGCDVIESECSVCHNVARTPSQYCAHVSRMKGQRVRKKNEVTGKVEDVLVHEICRGLSFFENSLLVEEPADPTAYTFGLDTRGIEMSPATASLLSEIEKEGRDNMARNKTASEKTAYNGMNPPPDLDEDGNEIEYEGPSDDSWINGEEMFVKPKKRDYQREMFDDMKMGSKTSSADTLYEVVVTYRGKKLNPQTVNAKMEEVDPGTWGMDNPLVWSDRVMAGYAVDNLNMTLGSGYTVTIEETTRKTAADDGRVPYKVDTLRPQECPVCGDAATWNSDGRCSTCGYLPAPKPFREPDTDVAGRVDDSGGWFDPNLTEAPPFEAPDERDVEDDPVQSALSHTKGQRKVSDSSPQGDNDMTKQNDNSVAMAARRRVASRRTQTEAALVAENEKLRERLAAATKRADKDNPAQPVPDGPTTAPAESEEETMAEPEAQNADVESAGGVLADPIQNGPADVAQIGGIVQDEIVAGTNQTDNVEAPVADTTEVDPAADIRVQPDHRGETMGEPAFAGDWVKPGADSVPDIGGNAAGAPEKEASRQSRGQRIAVGKQVSAARDRIWASIHLASQRIESGIEQGELLEVAKRIEASDDSVEIMNREASTLKTVAARRRPRRQRRQVGLLRQAAVPRASARSVPPFRRPLRWAPTATRTKPCSSELSPRGILGVTARTRSIR